MKAISKVALAGVIIAASLATFVASQEQPQMAGDATSNVSANAGVTRANHTMRSSRSTFQNGESQVSLRSAVLVNESSTPLLASVAARLSDHLAKAGVFESVHVHSLAAGPVGPCSNGRPPDVIFRIREKAMKWDGTLASKLSCEIELVMGTAPWSSNYHCSDYLTPPVLEFSWKGHLTTEYEFTGLSTDVEGNAAEKIAEKLTESVAAEVEPLRSNFSEPPDLPDEMYGEPGPEPQIGISPQFRVRMVADYPGLLAHRHTYWLSPISGEPADAVSQIADEAERAGWKKYDDASGENPRLRMTRGEQVLSVFLAGSEMGTIEKEDASAQLVVHYCHRFSEAERADALAVLFATNLPPEKLLPFASMLSGAEDQKFQQRIRETQHHSPSLYIHLAKRLTKTEDDEAIDLLLRAEALATIHPGKNELSKKIREEMKKRTGREENPEVTADALRASGFQELAAAMPEGEAVLPIDQVARFYATSEGKPIALGLRVSPGKSGAGPTFVTIASSDGAHSSGTRGMSKGPDDRWSATFSEGLNNLRFEGNVQQLTSGEFKYSVKLIEP